MDLWLETWSGVLGEVLEGGRCLRAVVGQSPWAGGVLPLIAGALPPILLLPHHFPSCPTSLHIDQDPSDLTFPHLFTPVEYLTIALLKSASYQQLSQVFTLFNINS
jgi:hypothetical protein